MCVSKGTVKASERHFTKQNAVCRMQTTRTRTGEMMAPVGGEIKRLREDKGWSQPRLAVEAGVSVYADAQIENGRRSPHVGTLE